jgi:hypothetical protein
VPYVARSIVVAEHETSKGFVQAMHCLMRGANAMSKYQYLAYLTEIAIEISG